MNKICTFLAVTAICGSVANAQTPVSKAITDFNGFWTSSAGAVNNIQPDSSHMLLAFQYGSTLYSTGVGDSLLNQHNVIFQPERFEAFQLANNTINKTGSTVIGVGYKYGGNGNVDPIPVNANLPSYLSDGLQGLDLGTAIFNAAPNNLLYTINTTNDSAIGDGKPDILVTQVGQPPATSKDSFRFIDINGVTVGHAVAISVAGLPVIGNGSWKFYNTDSPMTYNAGLLGSRPLRMVAFDFADFGIDTANIGAVKHFVHRLSGESDQAFVAYNYKSFSPATGVTLPVSIAQFDAAKDKNTAKLYWTVASASAFATFVVERSGSDNKYQTIGEVAFSEKTKNYSFTDNQPLTGVNLYRLKLVDQDNTSSYSGIRRLDFARAGNMVLYPNPFHDFLVVSSLEKGDVVSVNNAAGTEMKVKMSNATTLDCSAYPAGIYTITVFRNHEVLQSAVVIKK